MNISTLSRYLIRNYLEKFFSVFFIICSALIISNIFDLLNKTRGISIDTNIFIRMIFLKLPYLFSELLPLNAMLAMFLMYYVFAKRNEMVAIWGNGISIFGIILPISFTVLTIGILTTTILNPVSTYMLAKYEKIEAKLINKKTSSLILSDMGVIIAEHYGEIKRIYVVKSLDITTGAMGHTSLIITDDDNNYIERIDAKSAKLANGYVTLKNLSIYDSDGNKKLEKKRKFSTYLSVNNFVDGVTSPDNINFWRLPEAIYNLKQAGLPIVKHQLYYYKILYRPLLMVAFIFLATCFISRDNRSRNKFYKVILGLVCGFGTFLMLQILGNIMVYNGLSPIIAMALPTLIIILLSSFAILHLRMD